MPSIATVVGIHGAWAGSWVWEPIREPLARHGLDFVAVSLPGTPEQLDISIPADLAGNVHAVLHAIEGLSGPVILAGHSGGSLTATATAEAIPHRVAGVVHVAGMMLPSGMSYRELCLSFGERFADGVGVQEYLERQFSSEQTVVPPEVAVAFYFQLAEPRAAIATARRLLPQAESNRTMRATWTAERAGRVPRLYVEALYDRSLPIDVQRKMQQLSPGALVVSLPSDHAPQLSQTLELADAIAGFAEELALTPRGMTPR
ncbi:alpha/beta fold hydrolase [Subtercola endophyticus]|uniref:alpha/beta fold hydrolase n=1 Tax=Subtercola endophyticus TaxID=2895559 RepID=UPI001E2C9622|nr:alpha/beta hydrolase [Subtercola endophyticus]UFS60608.1 alpha/beta hydrolase [Subtercola endophyticus]